MFTYIDPTVRKRLIEKGKLVRIDSDGQPTPANTVTGAGARAISILGPIPLPLIRGEEEYAVEWYASVRHTELSKAQELADDLRECDGQQTFAILVDSMAVNSVLLMGDPLTWKNPLVRVHSSCLTGDVFGSERCECGPQLDAALQRIAKDEAGGMVIYMSGHEGRGIGLWAKAATYLLQDGGEDTYQANTTLGLPEDSRDFSDAASILKFFVAGKPFRLLTNNPKKVTDLEVMGVENISCEKHVCGVSDANRRYLKAKRDRGHRLDENDLNRGE
jgi:GTP cyclohydrolase II